MAHNNTYVVGEKTRENRNDVSNKANTAVNTNKVVVEKRILYFICQIEQTNWFHCVSSQWYSYQTM